MTISEKHKIVVTDYERLIKEFGEPEDLGSAMVWEEALFEAVCKGTKLACFDAIRDVIQYGFQIDGYWKSNPSDKTPDEDCKSNLAHYYVFYPENNPYVDYMYQKYITHEIDIKTSFDDFMETDVIDDDFI